MFDSCLSIYSDNKFVKNMLAYVKNPATSPKNMIFCVDALVSILIESVYNHLPLSEIEVTTPTNSIYCGLKIDPKICCISLFPNGEIMEAGIKKCDPYMDIGRILVFNEVKNKVYVKLPENISSRFIVLVLSSIDNVDPILEAIQTLSNNKVHPSRVIIFSLFANEECLDIITKAFPALKFNVGEICSSIPVDISMRYYQ